MDTVAEHFGVAPAQVERDHLVSHVLAAIARAVRTDDVVFFGGTALSRTHLRDVRLSEDIDLLATGDHATVARAIELGARRLRRTHGTVTFNPSLTAARGSESSVLRTDGGLSVRIQLLHREGYPHWPTEVLDIDQRYSDAPPARLRVLTAAAFGAAKLSAWLDRHASRDLYDLYAMAQRHLITAESVGLFTQHGPQTHLPGDWAWSKVPNPDQWRIDLGH